MRELFARFAVPIILFVLAVFVLWLVTIIDIVRSKFTYDVDKIIWFFFVLLCPPVGMVLYFFIGTLQKSIGSDEYTFNSSTRYRDIGRK